jgi:hypothetical protein
MKKAAASYLLLVIAMVTVSCRKTPGVQPAPVPVPAINKLAKVEYNGGDYDSIFYNSDLQVIRIKMHTNVVTPFDAVYTFAYGATKKLTRIADNMGEHYDYVYINGVLTGVNHYTGNTKTDFRIYDYTNGKLTAVEAYSQIGFNLPGYELISEWELDYYADGNLKTETIYSYTLQPRAKYKQFTTTYTGYDAKINATGMLNRFIYLSQVEIQKNNPGKMTRRDEVNGTEIQYDFAYTYNDFSNPLTQLMTGTGANIAAKYHYY